MAIESTTIITLYDDAAKTKAFAPRTKVEAISNNSGTSLQNLLDAKMNANNNKFTNGIEIHHATTPYVDFHYENNQGDYTSRIIESSSGTLNINGVTFNSGKITLGNWNGSTIGVAYGGTGATTAAGALTNLGLTATAAELNYCDGVTSNIQTQLNGKSPTSHNHDSTYVNISGDTMTGALIISHSDTSGSTFKATNSNGTISLHASINKGVYDNDAGVWLISKEKSTGYTKIPGKVVFTNTADLSGTAYNGPALTIGGEPTAAHIEIDANEIVAKANETTTATLWLGDSSKVVADNKLFKGDESTNVPAVFISSSTPTAKQTGDIWFVI